MIVFLQNAWSPFYAGREWPRVSWIAALKKSRTGKRLSIILGDDFSQCYNTTPIVGKTPKSVVPPDLEYIRRIVEQSASDVVLACGKQAEEALLSFYRGRLMCVPHPTSRLLTNALYTRARGILDCGFTGQLALRQNKGHTSLVYFGRKTYV